jgi:hypothetical protein
MITIKDWNSLPETKRETVVNFVHGGELKNQELFNVLKGKYIASTAKLTIWHKTILESVYKTKEGKFFVQIKMNL